MTCSGLFGCTYALVVEPHTKFVVLFDGVLLCSPVAELVVRNTVEELLDTILVATHRAIQCGLQCRRISEDKVD
jgi:hypothetical protein